MTASADDPRALLEDAASNLFKDDDVPLLGTVLLRGESLSSAQVTGVDVSQELANQMRDDVQHHIENLLNREFLPFDPSYQTSPRQVLVEHLSGITALENVDQRVRGKDVPRDNGGKDFPLSMAHVLGDSKGGIVAYRLQGQGLRTKTRRITRLLLPHDGVYSSTEEVLFYDPSFDLVTCAGYAFFTKASLMQNRLEAPDKQIEQAQGVMDLLLKEVIVKDSDAFARVVVSDSVMRAKVAQIARLKKDPDYADRVTHARLCDFVVASPHLGIEVKGQGDDRELVFRNEPQERFKILKLLADDFLTSVLTDRNYEAGSKHRIGS